MGFNSGFKGLIKAEFSLQTFEQPSNTKFHENPASGSRVAPCGRTHTTMLMLRRRLKTMHLHRALFFMYGDKVTQCNTPSCLQKPTG